MKKTKQNIHDLIRVENLKAENKKMKIPKNNFYLPKDLYGEIKPHTELTHTQPRKWTKGEEDWALNLREEHKLSNIEISHYLNRSLSSTALKIKRLGKKMGTYNDAHKKDKYHHNTLFLNVVPSTSVLDLYSGEKSFYQDKVPKLTSNDKNPDFESNHTYSEDAEKLICRLYSEGKRYDVIDLDSFNSSYDCFSLAIKMAKKGLIITLGEMGHTRWKRLDYVKSHYGIDSIEKFNSENIVNEIIRLGKLYRKKLTPVYIRDYRYISRVWFKVEKISDTGLRLWNKNL